MTTESATPDPYKILGVGTDATDDQVRKAWRKKTKAAGPGSAEFAAVNSAAELLLDRVRRATYDAEAATRRLEAERAAAESAVVDTPPEPETTAAPGAVEDVQRSQRPPLSALLKGWSGTAVVAGVVAVLAVVLAIWQGIDYANHKDATTTGAGTGGVAAGSFDQPASVQTAVTSTVQIGLPAVLSYSYDSMAADQANADRFLTRKLRTSLDASFKRLIAGGTPPGCTRPLAPIATTKTVVTATVVSLGVVSVSASSAQIGAFVNQTTTTNTQAAKTTQNRVLVGLVKQGNTWLIDSMSVPNTDGILNC